MICFKQLGFELIFFDNNNKEIISPPRSLPDDSFVNRKTVTKTLCQAAMWKWKSNRMAKVNNKDYFEKLKKGIEKDYPHLNKLEVKRYTKKTIRSIKNGILKEGETLAYLANNLGFYILGTLESFANDELDKNFGEENDE